MQLSLRCLYEPELAGGAGRAKCEVFPIRLHTFGTHELRRDRPSTAILFPPDLADAEHPQHHVVTPVRIRLHKLDASLNQTS